MRDNKKTKPVDTKHSHTSSLVTWLLVTHSWISNVRLVLIGWICKAAKGGYYS